MSAANRDHSSDCAVHDSNHASGNDAGHVSMDHAINIHVTSASQRNAYRGVVILITLHITPIILYFYTPSGCNKNWDYAVHIE